jgi:hypothetical protein
VMIHRGDARWIMTRMVLMEEEAEWMGGLASVATSHSGKRKSRPKKAGATDHSRRVLMSDLKVRTP